MKFLLDSNIISDTIQDSHGRATTCFRQRGVDRSCTSVVIAAHALALDCTLVTDNVREFSRVKVLAVENWLR